jgi:hypothetical protein
MGRKDSALVVFFRPPKHSLKLNPLKGTYRWETGYASDTIEFRSDSTLLSNHSSSNAHKTLEGYCMTDRFILMHDGGNPTPQMFFPQSGNNDSFTARVNFSRTTLFRFTRLPENSLAPELVGKWNLGQMEWRNRDFHNDTIMHNPDPYLVEITPDSIFWGETRYGYQWDYSKRYMLCHYNQSEAENHWQAFTTFKLIDHSDKKLVLERLRSNGTFTYVLDKQKLPEVIH